MEIVQSEVKGEPGTGYESPDQKGRFECGNCHHYKNGFCSQKTMMKVSKRPKDKDGYVRVEELGCCEYVDRIGQKGMSRSSKMSMV